MSTRNSAGPGDAPPSPPARARPAYVQLQLLQGLAAVLGDHLAPRAAAADEVPVAGEGELPADRRRHPGPEPPVLRRLAHDRPVLRLLREAVSGLHDQIGGLRGQDPRAAHVQARPAAGVPRPRRRRTGAEAGRAGAAGRRLRDRLPGGDRDPRPGPVADGGQDGRRAAGADHRGAGDPDRALGRAGDPPLRHQEAPPVPAQDRADGGRAAGGPVRLRRPAARREHAARGHRRHHGRHHRLAGHDQAADAPRRALRSRRPRRPSFFGPNGGWCLFRRRREPGRGGAGGRTRRPPA